MGVSLIAERVRELIEDMVESRGYELVHVEYGGGERAPILRIYIDRPGGVTVDDCAEISRRVSVLLDVEDLIPGHYVLEVSSPGVERPLFAEKDFLRFRGHEVRVSTVEKVEDRKNFKGVIEGVADGRVHIRCDDRTYTIPLRLIKKANLVYHFN
ncbi:MAG: ribosome maturation factor RimP [Acidobacteriota bacterium]